MISEIAFATMSWKDNWYLKIWVDYYSRYIDRCNLFVLMHDRDEEAEEIARGCNIIRLHRRPIYRDFDRDRWMTIQYFVNALLFQFRVVVFNDVDEILVVDPDVSANPVEYILCNEAVPVNTPFGFDIVHRSEEETEDIGNGQGILAKRRFVRPTTVYSKPCILRQGVRFKAGGHGCDHPALHLSPNIYLMHMRTVDREMSLARLMSRTDITTDPISGESIQSLGPRTWRMQQHEAEEMMDGLEALEVRPNPTFDFQEFRLDYQERFGEHYSHGLFGIKNKEARCVFELPMRFRSVF